MLRNQRNTKQNQSSIYKNKTDYNRTYARQYRHWSARPFIYSSSKTRRTRTNPSKLLRHSRSAKNEPSGCSCHPNIHTYMYIHTSVHVSWHRPAKHEELKNLPIKLVSFRLRDGRVLYESEAVKQGSPHIHRELHVSNLFELQRTIHDEYECFPAWLPRVRRAHAHP